jgi:hypothetical protein
MHALSETATTDQIIGFEVTKYTESGPKLLRIN